MQVKTQEELEKEGFVCFEDWKKEASEKMEELDPSYKPDRSLISFSKRLFAPPFNSGYFRPQRIFTKTISPGIRPNIPQILLFTAKRIWIPNNNGTGFVCYKDRDYHSQDNLNEKFAGYVTRGPNGGLMISEQLNPNWGSDQKAVFYGDN